YIIAYEFIPCSYHVAFSLSFNYLLLLYFVLFFLLIPRPPIPTLFPYTTLFRSAPARSTARPAPGAHRRSRRSRARWRPARPAAADRKSTRLNSSHVSISYAVFCLKKKTCVWRGEL